MIVVGFDQQVKCQLLNAMAGQKDKFQQFSCRRSAIVKPVKYLTVGGSSINLVQTPSLGTPGWKKVETDFGESLHWTKCKRMFFYVKTEPSGVDDNASIKDIQDKFGINLVRIVSCYCQKSDESSGSLDDVQYRFHLDSSFEIQKAQSQTLLECLEQKEMQSPKASQIGADKSFAKSVPKQSSAERQEAIDIASTVEVADPEGGLGTVMRIIKLNLFPVPVRNRYIEMSSFSHHVLLYLRTLYIVRSLVYIFIQGSVFFGTPCIIKLFKQ